MNPVNPYAATSWLLHGSALNTRRRRAGADAQRGFDHQRAFALLKVVEMIDPRSLIAGVRYEGAQDVDILHDDGRVSAAQVKNESGETYPPSSIAKILLSFTHDLIDSGENPDFHFQLLVGASPGSLALQRLKAGATTDGEREIYLAALCADPALASLGVTRLATLLATVLKRVTVKTGAGWQDDGRHGVSPFRLIAEHHANKQDIADEFATNLLNRIETHLKARQVIAAEEVRAWARASRRRPDRVFMAPALPTHFEARPAILARLREQLVATRRVALTGLGGAGKTMLAQALASDLDVADAFPDGVLWLSLGQTPNVDAHLLSILAVLGRPAPPESDLTTLHAAFTASLAGQRYLLVLDDLWHIAIGNGFTLPDGCALLVTTRQPRVAKAIDLEPVDVGALEPDEAISLAERISGELVSSDLPGATQFIKRVGGLAFAIRLGAFLVAEGRSFARLIADLDAEETRLSSLDIDRMDAPNERSDRRTTSLEACLGLSVAILPAALLSTFFRLALLPEEELVEPELGAAIFGLDDGQTAKDRLLDLAVRGLITPVGPSWAGTFRVHDLVLDYARSGFGSRRSLVGAPEELPATVHDLHNDFLNRSLSACPQRLWVELSPADHFNRFLAFHLIRAGRPDDLAEVLRERVGEQATWLTRLRRQQATADFFRFVRLSAKMAVGPLQTSLEHRWIDALRDLVTATAAGASAIGRAARIPVGLLSAIIRSGEQSFEDALSQAEMIPGVHRTYQLVDLLPLAPASIRNTLFERIIADLVRQPLPLIDDQELLDRLLPALSGEEIATFRNAARTDPQCESDLLWGLVRTENAHFSVEEIVAYCRSSENLELRGTLALLQADGLVSLEISPELIASALGSKRLRVKNTAMILFPASQLAPMITAPNIAIEVMDRWSRYRARPDEVLIEAIWALVDRWAAKEPIVAAWMAARLMAATGHAPPDRFTDCETMLGAVNKPDWRVVDGLGCLVEAASSEAKLRVTGNWVDAAAACGFRELGFKRVREIVAAVPAEAFPCLVETAQRASSGRAMIFAVMLEYAPEELRPFLSQLVGEEALRSNDVGDLVNAGAHMSGEALRWLWQSIDHVRPSPELVHAVAALTAAVPRDLVAWLKAEWPRLRPEERLRAAAGHSDIAALYTGTSSILKDLALAHGLLRDPARLPSVNGVDRADIERILAAAHPTEFTDFLDAHPDILGEINDFQIDTLLTWFGAGLSLSMLGALDERIAARPNDERAGLLGKLGRLTGKPGDIDRAISALAEHGSKGSAAIWMTQYGAQTTHEQRLRLYDLRDPDMASGEAAMLEVALQPFMTQQQQHDIEARFVQRCDLRPVFVASLERAAYSAKMNSAFDVCLRTAARSQATSPDGAMNWLHDAKRLLAIPAGSLELLIEELPADKTLAIRSFAVILLTAAGMDVENLSRAITLIAPLLRRALDERDCVELAQELITTARAHSN